MKKLKLQAVVFLMIVATAMVSCSLDDDQNHYSETVLKTEFVTKVEGPETGTINQDVLLNVTYSVGGDCSELDKVIETTTGNTKTIVVRVKYDKTKYCTQPTTQTIVYKFKATVAGTYILKFKKSATEFITQTIVVS